MQIFMLEIFAQTMTKRRNFIGGESHVIAVQPPLSKDQRFTNIIKYPYLLGRQRPANKCLKSFEDNFSTQYHKIILKQIW